MGNSDMQTCRYADMQVSGYVGPTWIYMVSLEVGELSKVPDNLSCYAH